MTDVLRQVSVTGIVAVGMTLVILIAGIDLSVGSILALGTVICAMLLTQEGWTTASYIGVPAVGIVVFVCGWGAISVISGMLKGKGPKRNLHTSPARTALVAAGVRGRLARFDDVALRSGAGQVRRPGGFDHRALRLRSPWRLERHFDCLWPIAALYRDPCDDGWSAWAGQADCRTGYGRLPRLYGNQCDREL